MSRVQDGTRATRNAAIRPEVEAVHPEEPRNAVHASQAAVHGSQSDNLELQSPSLLSRMTYPTDLQGLPLRQTKGSIRTYSSNVTHSSKDIERGRSPKRQYMPISSQTRHSIRRWHYGPHFRWITLRYLVKSLSHPLFWWIPGESGWGEFPKVILDEWILIHFTWYSEKNHQSPPKKKR